MADRIPVSLAGHLIVPGTPPAVYARHGRDGHGRLQYLNAYFDALPDVRFFVGRRAIAFMDAAIYELPRSASRSEDDTWTISVECEPARANEVRRGPSRGGLHGAGGSYRGIPAPANPDVPVPWQPIVSAGTIRECLLFVADLLATREQPFVSRLRVENHSLGERVRLGPGIRSFETIRCGKYSLDVQAGRTIQCLPRFDVHDLTTYFAWEVFLPDAVKVWELARAWPGPGPGVRPRGERVAADLNVLFGEHHEPDDRMLRPAAFVPSAVVQRLVEALDRLGEDQGPEIAPCEPLGACDLGQACDVHRGVDSSRIEFNDMLRSNPLNIADDALPTAEFRVTRVEPENVAGFLQTFHEPVTVEQLSQRFGVQDGRIVRRDSWQIAEFRVASGTALVPGAAATNSTVVHPKGPVAKPRSKRRSERAPRGRK